MIKPTGLGNGQYSIPKGIVHNNESLKCAAIRETFEEVGIMFNLDELGKQFVVNYFNNDKVTKRVFCYLVKLTTEKEKNMVFNLQKEEVDSYGFYDHDEAMSLIFWRYKDLLSIQEIWS